MNPNAMDVAYAILSVRRISGGSQRQKNQVIAEIPRALYGVRRCYLVCEQDAIDFDTRTEVPA